LVIKDRGDDYTQTAWEGRKGREGKERKDLKDTGKQDIVVN